MSCSMRGNGASCSFTNAAQNGHEACGDPSRASEAQLRLHRLEEMVTDLMQTTKKESESCTVDHRLKDLSVHSSIPHSQTSSTGHLETNGTETNYLGATHWATILDNVGGPGGRRCSRYAADAIYIRDLQGFLKPDEDNSEETSSSALPNGLDLVFGTTQWLTLSDACNSLPPRPVIDRLFSVYFNARYHQIRKYAASI